MIKLKRTEVLAFKQKLYVLQRGRCLLCNGKLPLESAKQALDHNHITGEVRGLLHMGCNKIEGSVFHTVGTWGGVGKDYSQVLPVLRNLINYLESPGHGVLYHLHKTPEEKQEADKAKRRRQYAAKKAAERIKR